MLLYYCSIVVAVTNQYFPLQLYVVCYRVSKYCVFLILVHIITLKPFCLLSGRLVTGAWEHMIASLRYMICL